MLSKISKNPVTNFLIGVGGIIIGIVFAVGFYFVVERKEIQPRYAVSEPETLAEATADAPGLKLLWEEEEIENAHTIDIVIWNAGRQFLDKSAISATDPIRVTYPPDVQILYAKFIRTSRDNLQFTTNDLTSAGTRAIQLEIVGDEALERRDGGLLKILFSGPPSNEFVINGRIKGSREGFKRVDWDEVASVPEGLSEWLATGASVLGVVLCIAFAVPIIRIVKKDIRRSQPTAIVDLIFELGGILILGHLAWQNIEALKPLLFGLPWFP